MNRYETLTGEVIEAPSKPERSIDLHWFTLGIDQCHCGTCGKLFDEGLHYWYDYTNAEKENET